MHGKAHSHKLYQNRAHVQLSHAQARNLSLYIPFTVPSWKQDILWPTLDEGPGSNFLGTNLDWFEANWIIELDYTLVPCPILGPPNQELSF
jgi:hypothetical protein